ncbi:MAG TPA: protein kinase, partial [Polyangiales bacterium]
MPNPSPPVPFSTTAVLADTSVADGNERAALVPATLGPGTRFAERFVLEGLPRQGGMGLVFRARDEHTGASVALKLMGRRSENRLQRFVREATILASLEHEAIVRYVAHGVTADGAPYLAMEWLDGEDLSDRLRRGALSLDESAVLMRKACDALAAAHARGVVHRDVKPSNLFLVGGAPSALKVLDFGISREAEAVPITRDGDCLGTVGYMAPEQAMGQTVVDARADVFALGCVLYECVTGRAPFESPHAVAVLAKVLRDEPPPPSELRTDLPPAFDAFVARLLTKDPRGRPADAEAMRHEFDAVLAELGWLGQRPRVRIARSEQKVTSVILGKPVRQLEVDSSMGGQGVTMAEDDLRFLERNFSADAAPLQGGALLLLLSTRGEAHDRAAQAAQCALALRELRPELRLAIATGLAETTGPVPVGVAIDRAAELLEHGAEGAATVVVDELTAGLIGRRFELQSSAGRTFLLRARAELDAPRMLMGKPTPCVGRDMELRLLASAIEECISDSSARAVLVTGPPGIGKSRLASEWLEDVAGQARIWVARADPMTAASSLSLLQDLVRHAIGLREAESPPAQRARLSARIHELLPAEARASTLEFLAELLGLPEGERCSPMLRGARDNPEIMREQVRRAIDGWLDAEVACGALILVLEDLHWADASSVEVLASAMKRHASYPLLLLALARPEVEQQFPELCQRTSLQLRLSGLTPRAAERLVRAALDPAPSDDVIARVVRTAEGNAFYLEELIRRVAAGSTDLPETVLAMAQSRLERLESPARQVLRAASVFGETFWAEGVSCMVDPAIDVAAELTQLTERELLLRVPNARYAGTHEYRYRHALLRDAAYSTLTQPEREQAHCAAGSWLERMGEKEARLLAEHFVSGKANSQAVPWLVRATRAAIDHGDLRGTEELAQRGIELGASGLDLGLLLLARGHAGAWSANADVGCLRDALALLPHGSAPWWLAVALLTLAESASGRPQEAARYVSLALTAPPSSEQVGSFGQALLTLAGALVLLGHGELCGTLIERAQALPQETNDPLFTSFLHAARCALASVAPIGGRWHLEYAYRQGREGVEAMRAMGALCGESMSLDYFAVAATHLGRYADAKQACQRALTLAQHVGSGLTREWAGVFLAKAQVRLGQAKDALSTLSTLHASRDRNLLQMLPSIASEALFSEGRYEEAIVESEVAVAGPSPRLRRMAGCVRAKAL